MAAGIILYVVLVTKIMARPMNAPSCSADDPATFILRFDGVEFKVDELRNVPNERQDLSSAIVDQCQGRHEIDNGIGY